MTDGDRLDRRVAVLLAGLCLLAVVVDAVWLSRLPTPFASPSLLLVLVVGAGLLGGPTAGAVTGLASGLLVDLAPPSALVVGAGAAGLACAGAAAGALVRRRPGPHRPRGWARALTDAASAAVAALVGLAVTALAVAAARPVVAADTPLGAGDLLPGVLAGAAYAAVVALLVVPALRSSAARLTSP